MENFGGFVVFVQVVEMCSFVVVGCVFGLLVLVIGKCIVWFEVCLNVWFFYCSMCSIMLMVEGVCFFE